MGGGSSRAEERKEGQNEKGSSGKEERTSSKGRSGIEKVGRVSKAKGFENHVGETRARSRLHSGRRICKRGYKTAAQLMDQYKGNKKGQCNSNDEAFKKWVLCCFGYWNTQFSKVVLEALKAADAVGISGTKGEANGNQGETFGQMVGRVAEG